MDDEDTKYGTRRQIIKMAGIAGAGLASSAGVASASGSKGSSKGPTLKRWRCAGVGAKAWDGKGFDQASKVHALFKNKKGDSLKFKFNDTNDLPKAQTKGGVTVELSKANLMIKGNRMRKGYALKRVWTPETGAKTNPKFGECFEPDPDQKPVLKRWRCAGVGAKAWDGKGFDQASKVHALFKNKNGKSLRFKFNSTSNLPKTQTKGGVTVELSEANLMIEGNRMRKGYALKRVWTPETGAKTNPKFGECFEHEPEPKKPEIKSWRCASVRAKANQGKGFSKASKVHARYKKKNGKSFAVKFNDTKNLPKAKEVHGKTFKLTDSELRIKGDSGGYTLKRIWTPETGTKNNPKFGECFEHEPEPEKPKVECKKNQKKIVVKNVPKDCRKGYVTFVYKNRGGKRKRARITLNWIKPGNTKRKRAFTITRTDNKVIATTNANWKPYKAKGKVDGEYFSHKCK